MLATQHAQMASTLPSVFQSPNCVSSTMANCSTSAEIAHLVYHGSTKTESFDNVGQFGSGFLSTHLLSRVVRVEGMPRTTLVDSSFSLDRTSGTVEELRLAMDRSWKAFEQSVEDTASGQPSITSFVYAIAEQVRKLAQEGLDDLYRCGPLVLAFCPEIASIAVETAEAEWSLERGDREPLHEGGVLSIQEQQDGQTLSRFVAVTEGEAELCVALQLCPSESSLRLDLSTGTSSEALYLVSADRE